MQGVIDEINESVAGVTATQVTTTLNSANTTGNQIIVGGNAPGGVGLVADTYEGFYTLETSMGQQ